MGLCRSRFIEFGIGSAIIPAPIKFNVIRRIENRIGLTLHINGLLSSAMKEL